MAASLEREFAPVCSPKFSMQLDAGICLLLEDVGNQLEKLTDLEELVVEELVFELTSLEEEDTMVELARLVLS